MNPTQFCRGLFAVILSGFAVGCHDSNEQQTAQADKSVPQTSATAVLSMQKKFTVKGFSIGMPASEAAAVIEKEHGMTVNRTTVAGKPLLVGGNLYGPKVRVYLADDDSVEMVVMDELFVNRSFKAEDMTAPAFARLFMEKYDLPQMDPITKPGSTSWSYQDANRGFEVAISERKSISIRKILKASERKFN